MGGICDENRGAMAKYCPSLAGIWKFTCDPPRDFGKKGERTGTRVITRHAKRVIMSRICLISKTECHGSFCLPLSWVVCQVARVQFGSRVSSHDTRAK